MLLLSQMSSKNIMAINYGHILHTPLSLTFPPQKHLKTNKTLSITSCLSSTSFSMDLHNQGYKKFMDFPYVSVPHREMMQSAVSMVEDRIGSDLLPCKLPLDVQVFENETGRSKGSIHIRFCQDSSLVDFVLGSWLHCQLPTGASLNITSLSAYLKPTTDAPNFLLELIRSSPTSAVLVLDLPPRRDLVLSPDYLQTFYENTNLETQRNLLADLPEAQPYVSPDLFIRCVVSPTATMVRIGTETEERMDEIIKDHIGPVVKEVVRIWLNHSVSKEREVLEEEKAYLKKRDGLVKKKTIEIDIGTNLPRLFGPTVADRVLAAIKDVFNV